MSTGQPSHIIEIPEEYRSDFERDPITAWQSYGNYPQEAEFPYFEDRNCIRSIVDVNRHNPFNADTMTFDREFVCDDDFYRFVHIDLGLSGDAAGFAMSHVIDWVRTRISSSVTDSSDSAFEYLPVVQVDMMARFVAPVGGQIRFEDIRQVIYELDHRGFPILLITFDRFQSADSIQILRRAGFICGNLSLDRTLNFPVVDAKSPNKIKKVTTGMGKYATLAVWTAVKSAANSGRLRVPFYLPVSDTLVDNISGVDKNIDDYGNKLKQTVYITQIEKEMLGATYDSKVMKVKESPRGSIDLLEAVAGSYYNALNNVTVADIKESEYERRARLARQFREAKTDFERQEILKESRPEPGEIIKDTIAGDSEIGGQIFGGDSVFDD